MILTAITKNLSAVYYLGSLFFFLCTPSFSYGEIKQIDIAWNAFKCQNSCIQQIEEHFGAIKGVQNIQITASAGTASLTWDPYTALSFEPFRYAAAAIGFNLSSIKIKAKGTIQYQENNFYLISTQDQTRFHLIGPLKVEAGRYVPEYSLDTHPIASDLRDELLNIKNEGAEVTLSGPLFLPNYYPLTLVIENIEKEKNQGPKKR